MRGKGPRTSIRPRVVHPAHLALGIIVSASPWAASLADEEGITAYELGELIVTAKRPRVVNEVSTMDEILAEDIERSGARTLDEALLLMPGLYVRDGADGVPRIDVRGLRTRNILLLVDGVPVNSTFDGQFDPTAIQAENIARIKFTRGGSSVLYGPGGNAGVINVVTVKASDRPSGTLQAGQVFDDGWQAAGRFGFKADKLSWVISGSARDQNYWELSDDFVPTSLQPDGRRINSDREDQAAYSSLSWEFSDATSAGLSVGYNAGEYGKPPITVDRSDSIFANRVRYERAEYDGWTSQLVTRHALNDIVTFRPAVFYNERAELTNGFDDATYATQNAAGAFREDATTTIRGGSLQTAIDTIHLGLTTLSVSGRRESWNATGFTLESGGGGGGGGGGITTTPIDEDHHIEIYSVAGEWEKQLSDSLSAVAGTSWNLQKRADVGDADEWAWIAGGRYTLTGATRLRGSYARQIRFPTLRDLYEIDRGNPALLPERTDNIELGVEYDFPDGRSSVEFVLYRVDATDFIERGPSGVAENFEKLRFQGFELNGGYDNDDNLELRIGYTYLDSENRGASAETTAVQNRPKHKLNFRLDYDFASDTRLYAGYLYVADSLALSRTAPVETAPVGDYHVIDLGVSRSFRDGRLRLVGRIENLLDEDYRESFGFPQPGRRFYLGAELRL